MKQRQASSFFAGVLVTVLTLGLGTSALAAYQKQATLDYVGIKITLDGQPVVPTNAQGEAVEPFAIEGTTYLPVRGIASALGLKVDWDQKTSTVILSTQAADDPSATTQQNTGAETLGQKNAVSKANSYLSLMAFSRTGLIKQLEFEGFSTEEATYAADHCGADWNEQAAKKAQSYLDLMSFSRSGLIDQLLFEGFTQAQAEYGVSAVGY